MLEVTFKSRVDKLVFIRELQTVFRFEFSGEIVTKLDHRKKDPNPFIHEFVSKKRGDVFGILALFEL